MKWRRRRDSNPRNPFEVHFFSKEALSATQPLLHTRTEEKISTLTEFNLKLKKFSRLRLSMEVVCNKNVDSEARESRVKPVSMAIASIMLIELDLEFCKRVDLARVKKVKNSVDAWNRHNLNAAFLKSGRIAQLVEQRTENPCVPSSILGPATT